MGGVILISMPNVDMNSLILKILKPSDRLRVLYSKRTINFGLSKAPMSNQYIPERWRAQSSRGKK